MPKSKAKIPSKEKVEDKNFQTMAKEKIHQEIDDLGQLLSTVKTKFDKLDDKTKKKIALGVAGTAALIAGVVGAKKMSKKCQGKCQTRK